MANSSLPTPEQILAAHGFDFWIPELLTPGGLALISPSSRSVAFRSFEVNPQERFWYVRGELGEQTLTSSLESLPKRLLTKPNTQVFVSTLGSRMYQGHLAFEAFSNQDNDITEFGLHVEATTPSEAIEKAREPFGEFLEELAFQINVPLQFRQFSVAMDRDTAPLAFEIHIPFGTKISFEKGMFLPPLNHEFTAAKALYREALTAESPYYRLLWAFRLMDAIDLIRSDLHSIAEHLEKTSNFPKMPKISIREIFNRGATVTDELENLDQIPLRGLFNAWNAKRNAVAHFVFEMNNKNHVLMPSIGVDYRDFACSAAILLLYSRNALNDLQEFSREYLEQKPYAFVVDIPPPSDIQCIGALRRQPSGFGMIRLGDGDEPTSSTTDVGKQGKQPKS